MSDDIEVLENSEDITAATSDLESLLAVIKSKNFNPSSGLVDEPAKFEKVDSFFELVKDANNDENPIDENDENPIDVTLETEVGNEPAEPENSDKSKIDQNIAENGFSNELVEDEVDSAKEEFSYDSLDTAGDTLDTQETSDPTNDILDDPSSLSENGDKQATSNDFEDDFQEPAHATNTENTIENAAFDRGYQSAISEFEKAMELEKKALSELGSVMFKIESNLKDKLSDVLKKNIIKLSEEFIGSKIDEIPEQFIAHIKKCADKIFFEAKEIEVQLNHSDFELIKSIINTNDLDLKITESSDLRRGEFEISSLGSGLKQKFAD